MIFYENLKTNKKKKGVGVVVILHYLEVTSLTRNDENTNRKMKEYTVERKKKEDKK